MTFGEKFSKMRKSVGLTQEEVATHLGVSSQAVSKWENDLSCPDIMLLSQIARLYGTTVDVLLDGDLSNEENKNSNNEAEKQSDESATTEFSSKASVKNGDNKFLKVNVISQFGDKVDVKLPVTLIKSLKKFIGSVKLDRNLTSGVDFNLSELDFDEIFELVDIGVIGEIVNVVTQNGDTVKVYVETE